MFRKIILAFIITAMLIALVGCAGSIRTGYADTFIASLSGGANTRTTIEISTRGDVEPLTYEMAVVLLVEEVMAAIQGEELDYNLLGHGINANLELINDGSNLKATITMPDSNGITQTLLEAFIIGDAVYLNMSVLRDMFLVLMTRQPTTEIEALVSGMSLIMLTDYIGHIEYVTFNAEELDYLGVNLTSDNIQNEAHQVLTSIIKFISDGLRSVIDREYDVEKTKDGYGLVMSAQLFNRILQAFEMPALTGFQGRVTTEVTENRTEIIAELLNVATIEPMTMEIVISNEPYNGAIVVPADVFMQSVSEVIFVTGVVDYLLGEEPLEMFLEPVWDIRYYPEAYVATELAKMLMFHPMEDEIICIAHSRMDIPDEVLPVFLASCICSTLTVFEIYGREYNEELVLETLTLFDEELKKVQNEIVARLVSDTTIPGEYIMAMLFLINGDYESDFDIAQFSVLSIALYGSEEVEQAIIDVITSFRE